MPDIFTKKKRSEIMSKIRSKNTKTEVDFRKKVWNSGLMYRLHYNRLPGKPDLVFPSRKTAVFIDGCFWHKCPKCYKKPKSHKEYWASKIRYNTRKDMRVNRELKKMKWSVLRFWEHDVKKNPEKCIKRIMKVIKKFK